MTSRRKKIALGSSVGVAALFALFLASPARHFAFPKHYDVVPITSGAAYQDPGELARAFALPVASAYQHAPIVFQPNGSVCGPTSLANVARSLGASAATPTSILEGSGKCRPFGVCFGGLTLDELADLARRDSTRKVSVLRDFSYEDFKTHLVWSNDPARRYVLNFNRGPLFGKDGGHHSPIGGYLVEADLVLVLDVNEKYRPWLVPSKRLFEAMDTLDPSSGKKRGLLLIE